MRKPYLSVIIPAYNASGTLVRLLTSLAASSYTQFEVIVGDDASHEQLTVKKLQIPKQKFPLTVTRLTQNRGPAAARNNAVKRASGEVVVFFDADVTVYPDTIAVIAKKFTEDPDLIALTGVWDKHQHGTDFFPQFKALRDWSYWTNERDRDGYYYLFSTRNAAIRRSVFSRLGGFNEAFRQMEDVELTYRIARRYAIIFAPDVRVHHEFEGFWPVAKKYFWRSYYWTKLYSVHRKFDTVATTISETVTAVFGVGAITILIAGTLLYFIFPVAWIRSITLIVPAILLVFHIAFLRKFLWFVYREKGITFMIKALGTGLVLYTVIMAGAAYYQIKKTL